MNTEEDLWAKLKAALKTQVDDKNREREKEKRSRITYEQAEGRPEPLRSRGIE